MVRQLLLLQFALLFAFVTAAAEDPVTRDASIEQLKVFDPYVGEWRYSMKSTAGITMTGEMKTAWIHGGKLIRQTWKMEPTAERPGGSGENVMTYDVHQNKYRQWSFSSFGEATESTGAWDADKQVMVWTGKNSMGNELITRTEFSDPDTEQFRITVKNSVGVTLAEIEGTSTRR